MLWQEGTTHGEDGPMATAMLTLAIIMRIHLIKKVVTSRATQSWFADDAPHPVISGGRLTSVTGLTEQDSCLRAVCLANFSNANEDWSSQMGADTLVLVLAPTMADCWIRKPTACCFCGADTRPQKPLDMRPENVGLSCSALPAIGEFLRRVYLPSLTGHTLSLQTQNQGAVSFPRLIWYASPWNNQPNTSNATHHTTGRISASAPPPPPSVGLRLIIQQQDGDILEAQGQPKILQEITQEIPRLVRATPGVWCYTFLLRSSCLSARWQAKREIVSVWVTGLPLDQHGFSFHEGVFRDALCFWYVWLLPSTLKKVLKQARI